ncbi:MAG: hypothetical protein U0610_32880 [bacterium]
MRPRHWLPIVALCAELTGGCRSNGPSETRGAPPADLRASLASQPEQPAAAGPSREEWTRHLETWERDLEQRERALARREASLDARERELIAEAERARASTADPMRRRASCDDVYVALNGEVANELDRAQARDSQRCGSTAAQVVRCVIDRHRDERNPLDESDYAYVEGEARDACQVALDAPRDFVVVFSQLVRRGERSSLRTFSITIE